MIEYIPFRGGKRPFSTAVRAGNNLYVSGQVGIDRETGAYPPTIEGQTKQAIINLKTVLEEQGYALSHVVKMVVILTRKEDIAAFNKIYAQYFVTNLPARTLMVVSGLVGEAIMELDAIAVKE
ncbi:MAG TPA: RidA family protein [Firmicutes bacterium]|nr:RidA family protein [Bacillota bacterium]